MILTLPWLEITYFLLLSQHSFLHHHNLINHFYCLSFLNNYELLKLGFSIVFLFTVFCFQHIGRNFMHKHTKGSGFPGGTRGKVSACQRRKPKRGRSARSPGGGKATHSSILAWRSPGAEGLTDYSPQGHRVRHN